VRRWCGLYNSTINLILDKLIRFIVKNGAQERLNAVKVEVIGDNGRAKPQ
jgi:hypothetical protein